VPEQSADQNAVETDLLSARRSEPREEIFGVVQAGGMGYLEYCLLYFRLY